MSVGEHDDAAARIIGHDLIGPRQHAVAWSELQREHQPVHPAGAEQVITIVHEIGFEHPAKRRQALVLAQGKELVEKGRLALARPESVVVAHGNAHKAPRHPTHSCWFGHWSIPVRCSIGEVAFVQNKNNVRIILVIHNPLGLRREHVTRGAIDFPGVILRVRQCHDGKRLIAADSVIVTFLLLPSCRLMGVTTIWRRTGRREWSRCRTTAGNPPRWWRCR